MGYCQPVKEYCFSSTNQPAKRRGPAMATVLKKVGGSDIKLAKKIKEGIEADSLKTAHQFVTTALELKGHIKKSDNNLSPSQVVVLAPIIINGKPLSLDKVG